MSPFKEPFPVKVLKKYVYHIICTVLLVAISTVVFSGVSREADVSFILEKEGIKEKISIYRSEDGLSYVFLPAFAHMEELYFDIPSGLSVTLDGQTVSDGACCDGLVADKKYKLCVNGEMAELSFLASSEIASLFISTASGTMEHIHKDIDREEQAELRVYLSDGTVVHRSVDAYLKGRGNTTWERYDKKPYLLKLSAEDSLLGMSAGRKWVLLANASDSSKLRNKIVFDTANNILPGFAPESRYIDLYLNGEYAGLYLLSQKIDYEAGFPALSPEKGEFLGSIEFAFRMEDKPNAVTTGKGRSVEIAESRTLSKQEKKRIEALTNEMEEAIIAGETDELCRTLDIDSWVRRYLIDEIFSNLDSDAASSFFYYSDGLFHAGPIWDYDLTFGNYFGSKAYSDPGALIAKPFFAWLESSYNHALYNNGFFYQRMLEMYQEEFLPVLEQLLDGGIYKQAELIELSAKMDSLRWSSAGHEPESIFAHAEEMTEYMRARLSFLNELWLEGKDYKHVCFYSSAGEVLLLTSVESGECIEPRWVEEYGDIWLDSSTGEQYDFSMPVSSDLSLYSGNMPAETAYSGQSALGKREIIVLLSVFVMLISGLGLAAADIRCTREREVSSESAKV